MRLPFLYPILDVVPKRDCHIAELARGLFTTGCGIAQLRAKDASPQQVLEYARILKTTAGSSTARADARSGRNDSEGSGCKLILNDRPDMALLAGFDGCHLGQDDLSIAGARKILPQPKILGLSTHNEAQVRAGDESDADYLAIGPVFATASKADASPVLGVAEFARLRKLTSKPVVAIGGITRGNARQMLDAGADSVAMIGDLYRGCTAENFMQQFEENARDILARIL